MLTTKQKLWAIAAHIGYLLGVGFIIIPLAILLFCDNDEFVRGHAKEALCIQIIFGLVSLVVTVLTHILIGVLFWPVVIILGLMWVICSLKGAWRALNGENYSYPLTGGIVSRL